MIIPLHVSCLGGALSLSLSCRTCISFITNDSEFSALMLGTDLELQVDRGDPTNGTALYSPNDSSAAEDGGREDMFVDCPDEMETSEILQSFEDEDDIQNTQFEESDNGINVQNLMAEIEQLRGMLAEKDRFAQEYKVQLSIY